MFNFYFNQTHTIDWTTVIISTASAVIGALIAGYFTSDATKKAHKQNLKLEKLKEAKEEKNILLSIDSEIKGIKDIYEHYMDQLHDNERLNNAYYTFHFDINPMLKTIYDNNSDKIGLISNSDLRNKIIKFYIILRSYIGSLNLYRKMLDELEDFRRLFLVKYDKNYVVTDIDSIDDRIKEIKNNIIANSNDEERKNIESFYEYDYNFEIKMVDFSNNLDEKYSQLKNIANDIIEQIDKTYKESINERN